MNPSFEQNLERYADLIIKVGLNLQKNQELLISAPIRAYKFVRLVTEKAYEEGALNVLTDFYDEELKKIRLEKSPEEGLKAFPHWKAKGYIEMAENNVALLNLVAPNPALLKDIDPKKASILNKASAEAMQDFSAYIGGGKISWLIAAFPTGEWARTVFSELSQDEAIDKLWENIFYTTRTDKENTVSLWESHISELNKNANHLNERNYKKLHYKGPGTDLTIEFHPQTKWISAQFVNDQGTPFVPNLPTEEVFTIPEKYGVNGTVSSTKPLNYSGTLIKDFSLTFKNGKVVEFSAEEGYETLKNLLETDEGSSYLGEVALVPHHSPISNTNIIFNNTLFDENASCHIALGRALPVCVKDGKTMTTEQLREIGFNESMIHVDFMIGSDQLDIDGEKEDGTIEPIFKSGDWVKN
ncbi:aminopeptidase (plasmid) [Cytobacillus spongiae]|uniref:aminopeptidase n=1 Tax=Cytobacillus spongiae TaxID=2901381 RepID=UPI001F3F05D0|nr:aminopeptidase [Cytobacillus spongiae]UII58480.1 aminopeptidase [Cytobacillus spongiae]